MEAARAASAILVEQSSPTEVHRKGRVDLVTEVDLACERAIREVLGRHMPDVPVLGEEEGGDAHASTCWIVDPLDGTTNFVHGFPSYGVSIALQVDGVVEVGVIADPIHALEASAARGQGAYCNGARLSVSGCRELEQALVGTGFPYDRQSRAEYYLAFVCEVMQAAQGVRRAGAAALDLLHLASGRLDAFWEFSLSPWDVAAGVVLIEEAGGRVSNHAGGTLQMNRPSPLATNGWLHDSMMELLERGEARWERIRSTSPG